MLLKSSMLDSCCPRHLRSYFIMMMFVELLWVYILYPRRVSWKIYLATGEIYSNLRPWMVVISTKTKIKPSRRLCWYWRNQTQFQNIAYSNRTRGRRFDIHCVQTYLSACPVWIWTQINTTNIIFTWIHNMKTH